ncbi:MAG: hypothetical protein Q4E67_00325 [Planctomycetia bacterium]|nr:hypothetical protein [Planctomycetia bacterium]
MQRTFLNWGYPCLQALAELLVRRHQVGRIVDLSEYLFFFPSRIAPRRFLSILADMAYQEKLTIEVPKVRFLGDLPEQFYIPDAPFASMLVQEVVWMKAIRTHPEVTKEDCQHWLSRPLREEVLSDWLDLGEKVAEIHQELRKECLSFQHVADLCRRREKEGSGSSEETRRWDLLAQTHQRYLDMLSLLGVEDKQEARNRGLQNWDESRCLPPNGRIAVVGCVEMNRLTRQFLAKVSKRVEIFIFAPWEFGERFEEDGVLKSGRWESMDALALKRLSRTWKQVDTPYAQGMETLRWIESLGPDYPPDEVTLGIVRESLEPQLAQMLYLSGMVPKFKPRKEMSQLSPWQLLHRVTRCLKEMVYDPAELEISETLEKVSPQWESFVSLLRHPDLGKYLRHRCNIQGDWLSELDMFEKNFQPERIFSYHRFCLMTHGTFPVLQEVYASVLQLLEKMISQYENLGQIVPIVVEFFKTVYCWKSWYNPQEVEDFQVLRGCMEINVLSDKLQLPGQLNRSFSISLVEALELVVKKATGRAVAPTIKGETFSLQRWNDLLVDDSPAVLVAGLDEGIVSEESYAADILPEVLRQNLGMRTDITRYERNLYVLTTLLHSRTRVRFLFQGDPLDAWKKRVCFQITPEGWPIPATLSTLPPRREIRIEEFSHYAISSSRYYLNEILKLHDTQEPTLEARYLLDNLFQRVLHLFSEEEMYRQRFPHFVPMAEEREAQRYLKMLRELLDREYRKSFDATTRAQIFVQKERIRELLPSLAEYQARRTFQGWRIHRVGLPLQVLMRSSGGAGPVLQFADGKNLELTGKLERLDVHPVRQNWSVWTYDSGLLPEDPFRFAIYRHLLLSARQANLREYDELRRIPFAWLTFGKITPTDPHFQIVPWDEEAGEVLFKRMEDIAVRIHRGEFSEEPSLEKV